LHWCCVGLQYLTSFAPFNTPVHHAVVKVFIVVTVRITYARVVVWYNCIDVVRSLPDGYTGFG
jgi:hypothetical protein